MILRDIIDGIKESDIFKLQTKTGQLIGYRVKIYNVNKLDFDYYDFGTSIANNITYKQNWTMIELIQVPNGWATEAEIKGTIQVRECKSQDEVNMVLKQLEKVYKYTKEVA